MKCKAIASGQKICPHKTKTKIKKQTRRRIKLWRGKTKKTLSNKLQTTR